MSKDKEWLKEQVERLSYTPKGLDENSSIISKNWVLNFIDQLDEPKTLSQEWVNENVVEGDFRGGQEFWYGRFIEEEKVRNLLVPKQEKIVIPQFVADYIEKWKYETLIMHEWFTFDHDDQDEDKVSKWLYNNDYETNKRREFMLIDAIRYSYEVEKEILWEIPMPDLKTSDGHIQYLTYDPEVKTYFAGTKNGRLKQTFNAKDLASVPTPHRHYAVLCDFNKIEEEAE